MIYTYDTYTAFNTATSSGMLVGDLYYVKEDNSVHYTNTALQATPADYSSSSESTDTTSTTVNLGTLTVTSNGTYTATGTYDGYNKVIVNVPSSVSLAVFSEGNFTANGTYTPPSGSDGYSKVTVNVVNDLSSMFTMAVGSSWIGFRLSYNTNIKLINLVDSNSLEIDSISPSVQPALDTDGDATGLDSSTTYTVKLSFTIGGLPYYVTGSATTSSGSSSGAQEVE